MKIGIISPYATVVPHFETELEIAQRHLDQGDEVFFLNCTGGLTNCDFNPTRDAARCQSCLGRRQMGLELLQPQAKSFEIAPMDCSLSHRFHSYSPGRNPSALQTKFESLQKLREYKIENFDIGYAALSSLVSLYRDPEPDLKVHSEMLTRFLESAWQTYRETQAFIDRHQPDRIYVFNGRFAAMRAVFRAAQSRQVDCQIHERGCDNDHFDVIANDLPHDPRAIQGLIRQVWDRAADNPARISLAETWFQERLERVERNWHSFVKGQAVGQLPTTWDAGKKNIAIFCSSDDEFAAIGDCWLNSLYPDQAQAIEKISQDLLPHTRTHVTLRMHPNLKGLDHRSVRAMLSLALPNLTVIPPEAEVDSYALLRASDCVVTFGSTIGIEAVFWDRPSVLLGPSYYDQLGGTYQPPNHQQTINLLTSDLKPLAKDGALMYGFWLQTFGTRFKYFQATGLFDGSFKGQVLYARPPKKTLLMRIKNEFKRVKQRLRS